MWLKRALTTLGCSDPLGSRLQGGPPLLRAWMVPPPPGPGLPPRPPPASSPMEAASPFVSPDTEHHVKPGMLCRWSAVGASADSGPWLPGQEAKAWVKSRGCVGTVSGKQCPGLRDRAGGKPSPGRPHLSHLSLLGLATAIPFPLGPKNALGKMG